MAIGGATKNSANQVGARGASATWSTDAAEAEARQELFKIVSVCKGGGYRYCRTEPLHPKANSNGLYPLHRVLVENRLGRLLTDDEHVHHRDEDKTNDAVDNLEPLSPAAHARLHVTVADETHTCAACGSEFTIKPAAARLRLSRNLHRGLTCSRSCGAVMGERVKRSRDGDDDPSPGGGGSDPNSVSRPVAALADHRSAFPLWRESVTVHGYSGSGMSTATIRGEVDPRQTPAELRGGFAKEGDAHPKGGPIVPGRWKAGTSFPASRSPLLPPHTRATTSPRRVSPGGGRDARAAVSPSTAAHLIIEIGPHPVPAGRSDHQDGRHRVLVGGRPPNAFARLNSTPFARLRSIDDVGADLLRMTALHAQVLACRSNQCPRTKSAEKFTVNIR